MIQYKPTIIRSANTSHSKRYYLHILNFHLTSIKERLVQQYRRRIKFVPGQQSLLVWLTYLVYQIFLEVHTRHIVNNAFFVPMLGNVKSSPGHFGSRLMSTRQLVQHSSLSSTWQSDQLDSIDKILLEIVLQDFHSFPVHTAHQHYSNLINSCLQVQLLRLLSISDKFLQQISHFLQYFMFVQILLVYDVKFVDSDGKVNACVHKPIENVFLESTSNIKHVDQVDKMSGSLVMLAEHLVHEKLVVFVLIRQIKLIGQFIMIFKTVASLTIQFQSILSDPFNSLLFLFIFIYLFLQSQECRNMVKIVQFPGLIVEYRNSQLFLHIMNNLQDLTIVTAHLLTVAVLNHPDVIFNRSRQSFSINVTVFVDVVGLQNTITTIAPVLLIVPMH